MILHKIMEKYNLHQVVVNERIIAVAKVKIIRSSNAVANAIKKGGAYPSMLFKKWKTGNQSTWPLRIYYDELCTYQLSKENLKTTKEKRKLETKNHEVEAKVAKLELKVEKSSKLLAKERAAHDNSKSKITTLLCKISKLKRGENPDTRRKGSKHFNQLSRMQQHRIKSQMITDCQTTLSFLGLYDIHATKLELYNEMTDTYETMDLVANEYCKVPQKIERITSSDLDDVHMLLFIKDRFNISNSAYHELPLTCSHLPRGSSLIQRMADINAKWNIFLTASGEGVQQRIGDRLSYVIKNMQKKFPDNPCHLTQKVRVKINGDGTNIGKRLHVVIIAFTVIDEGQAAMLSEGIHTIAILKTTESYDDLKTELKDIIKDTENLKSISVDGKNYEIVWYLGGDWKFLASVTGIGAAVGNYPCIWCKCHKDEKHKLATRWSICDSTRGARTVEEITKLAEKKGNAALKFGCKNTPLFKSIPTTHIVIDTLHLFLRITDNLQNLLILSLRTADAIEKKKVFNDGFDHSRYKHMAGYEKFLNEVCKIDFHWFLSKETKELKWRDLTGPEKLRLIANINIPSLLPHHGDKEKIQQIWVDFSHLYKRITIQKDLDEQEIMQIQEEIEKWVALFLDVYVTKHLTPYMHAFLHHIHEFLRLHRNINLFNQQGLEKLNHDSTKSFFSATNQRGVEAFTQLLQKKNRLEYFKDLGCIRKKVSQNCRNCKALGHNIKTCIEKCAACSFSPYCSPMHLIKSRETKQWIPCCQKE